MNTETLRDANANAEADARDHAGEPAAAPASVFQRGGGALQRLLAQRKELDLAALKKRFATRAALAVTIGFDRIAVSALRNDAGSPQVGASFSLSLGADSVVRDPEKAGQELAAQIEVAGLRERRCVVCVPPAWALSSTTDLPEMSGDDLRGYLELRAEREFPVAVSELRLAHSAFSLPDGTRRATIAALPARRIEAVEKMLATAGCRAVSISLALHDCLGSDLAPALRLRAADGRADVILTAGSGVVALRALPGPSIATAESAAGGEKPGFDAAGFAREIRMMLGRLPPGLRPEVRRVRFFGNPAAAAALCRETCEGLGRIGLECPACADVERSAEPAPAAITAAENLLLDRPVAFEFVIPTTGRWELFLKKFEDKRRRGLVMGVAGLILLTILVLVYRSHRESSLAAEWSGMRRNVADLENLQGRLRQFRPWFDAAPGSLLLLESLASAFPETGEVWAKGVQVTDGPKVTCTGFARNQPALMGFMDRLRAQKEISDLQLVQQRGENPIQFSLTYRWGQKHDE